MNALHSLVARALGVASTQAQPLVRPADVFATAADPIVSSALPIDAAAPTAAPVHATPRSTSPESTTDIPRRSGETPLPPPERVVQSVAAPLPTTTSSRLADATRTADVSPRVVTQQVRLRERVEREIHRVHDRVTHTIVVPTPASAPASEAPREATTTVDAAAPSPTAAPAARRPPVEAATPAPRVAATRGEAMPLVSRVVTPPPQPAAPPMREAEAVTPASAPSVVHVHIDRVVVHATPAPPSPVRTTSSSPPGPDQLARYLEERAKR